jgi:hypothetical protein
MITKESIISIVSDYYKLHIDNVLSTNRKWELVKVRQISMYFMKTYINGITLANIGKSFPGKRDYKDHATIIHGIKRVKGYIDTDKEFSKDMDILDKRITDEFNINSVFDHIETESEKFERLWIEREIILISENKYLKDEVANLRNEISKLQGKIYGLKLNKKKSKKRKLQGPKLSIISDPYLKAPAINGREYSGFRQHSL